MKKYTSGSFTATKYAIYKEDTDTITTFPVEIIADGENASAVVYGNMQQTGTPTPITPITPSECGDLETIGDKAGQYKIPISSANTTTNIYLGEVQSTRNIKKLLLTGAETIETITVSEQILFRFNATYTNDKLTGTAPNTLICNIYKIVESRSTAALAENNFSMTTYNSVNDNRLVVHDDRFTSETDYKAYLADQYTNGTPVTVWYVLAESTTGILNEPIRKIGDYSDSLSATVPTLATAESITVDTTLKPSAVQLTYTGWHTHSDKKRSGGAWV